MFIDTGAFLARYIKQDQYHQLAVRGWQRIQEERTRCLTSNFVIDETLTLLARRTSYTFAANRAEAIYSSNVLEILRPDVNDELLALELFQKFADQHVSFTDCISFALMQKLNVKLAFSFDRHFLLAGFELRQS